MRDPYMRKRGGLIGPATVAVLILAPVSAGAQASSTNESEAILQPGDIVRMSVWQRPDYNGEFMVMADSTLAHPLLQTVKVTGVPLAEVKRRLRAVLLEYEKDPLVVVEPLHQISVIGEVRLPNVYAVPRATTVAQAVARGGGGTENANLNKVRLFRGGHELKIDLNDPRSSKALLPVRSGDQIVVGRKKNFVRDVLMPLASLTAAAASVIVVVR